MHDFDIRTDLSEARARAEETIRVLQDLRASLDLSPYEFTKNVRVAALVQPHSQPVLTLTPSFTRDRTALLGTYLHLQMDWYLVRRHPGVIEDGLGPFARTIRTYPQTREAWAKDTGEVRRALAATWLELEALSALLGGAEAEKRAAKVGHRRWLYTTALSEREAIGEVLDTLGIAPVPHATQTMAA